MRQKFSPPGEKDREAAGQEERCGRQSEEWPTVLHESVEQPYDWALTHVPSTGRSESIGAPRLTHVMISFAPVSRSSTFWFPNPIQR